MNRVLLIGRFTKDPELKTTTSGMHVVSFSLAVDNRTKNKDEKSASYINCVAWNATAENIAKYVRKGSQVAVDGHLLQRTYTNKENKNVSVLEVICDQVQFLSRARDDSSSNGNNGYTPDSSSTPSGNDDSFSNSDFDTDDQLPF